MKGWEIRLFLPRVFEVEIERELQVASGRPARLAARDPPTVAVAGNGQWVNSWATAGGSTARPDAETHLATPALANVCWIFSPKVSAVKGLTT